MRLLAFVDLHGDMGLLKELVKRAKEKDIDLVVVAGDLTMFEGNLGFIIDKLETIGKKVLIIPGNHESEKSLKKMIKEEGNCVYFNKKAIKIGSYIFLGYGESGFALEDKDFRKLARDWYNDYQKEKVIFVSHGPPFGTNLDKLGNRYTGNKDLRGFIERIKPKLVICGHLHENADKTDKIGETEVINPGWEGMVVELD